MAQITIRPTPEAERIRLARARLRGMPVPDVVEFVAACPGCGRDAQWREDRVDTRLVVTVTCGCTGGQ
jgi:hypothetical protein